MAPWTRGGLALAIATCLGLLSACTAWQYDIETCDPSLGIVACQRLNVAEGIDVGQDCAMLWQCNKSTLMCEKSVKDVDQDGDVLPKCGGTDCNDNDSRYSGIAQSCGCNLAGQPCKAGKGACVVDLTSTCIAGTLSCPEQNAPQFRDVGWHKEPFTGGSFSSWDWNCNGSGDTADNTEKNCAFDYANQAAPCQPTTCGDPALQLVQASTNYAKDAAAICDAFCSTQRPGSGTCPFFAAGPDTDINCIHKCGAPLFRCRCSAFCADVPCKSSYCTVSRNFVGTPLVSSAVLTCR